LVSSTSIVGDCGDMMLFMIILFYALVTNAPHLEDPYNLLGNISSKQSLAINTIPLFATQCNKIRGDYFQL
jgi:hypothetical protein